MRNYQFKKFKRTRLLALIFMFFGCGTNDDIQKIETFYLPLPKNWIDRSNFNVKDNLSRFDLSEKERVDLLKTHKNNIPIALYLKYEPSIHEGTIPTVQVNLRPNKSNNFKNFKLAIQKSIEPLNSYFTNYKLLQPIEEITIDGVKGVKLLAQFEMPVKNGEIWTIRSWTYAFPSTRYFYQINFSDTKEENCEDVYNKLIRQIKFKK